MKHLKTFENFSINEEEGIRKFFTGHDSSKDRDSAMMKFQKNLKMIETDVQKDPKNYVFDKESLEKKAKEDNYKGSLRIQRGRRNPKMYVVYDAGVTGFQKLAGASAHSRSVS